MNTYTIDLDFSVKVSLKTAGHDSDEAFYACDLEILEIESKIEKLLSEYGINVESVSLTDSEIKE